jgi:hypothetical protein
MNNYEVIKQFQSFGDQLAQLIEVPVPLNLGEIKTQLEQAIAKHEDKEKAYVRFAFGNAYPTTFDSYRGSYSELCIQFEGGSGGKYASEFLKEIENAFTEEFEGWKGCRHQMSSITDVYVACRGCTSKTRIIGILSDVYGINLLTAEIDG